MAWLNEEIAARLREYAELTQITGGDAFRARNYEKAARSVRGWGEDIGQLDARALRAIPGVGASIAAKIAEYRDTGSIKALDELRAQIPPGVLELTRVPGLGPKRALQLSRDLGVQSVDELAAAIKAGRLDGLAGFGAKSEERIASGIEVYRQGRERVLLDVASHLATTMVAALAAVPGTQRCTYAGSLRRMRETIGDVDILAAAGDSAPLMAAFIAQPEVAGVIASGPTKTSIRTASGLQVDLRVVPLDAWGAALQYFTGSTAHNVAVRQIAVRKKLRLSEYGLFEVETGQLIVSRTEEEVYARLGLAWVPPAMREDRGEIEAASQGEIPRLVRENDLKGDLHTHTNLTDGVASLQDMVAAAVRRGYEYYAITDHAPDLFMQRMTDEKMLAQRDRVRALDADAELLHGTELNIGPDGSVDWDEDFLAGFDLCVASVHSHFDQPRAEMTRRFITACENPRVNVIGHPTARRIGRRPPVDVDFGELFRACARTGTALEINASPQRLDLPSDHIRAARDAGVKFAIDSDAHAVSDLANMPYGVGTAQRGWLTPDDVINTWPLDRLRAFLAKGR
ncbi:MAG TPA: DNA polymerase/3'-5' exonuclease PolX [Streptosporangiaceae bacterium]|jgi:DNA polymerase (family 10)|nr:DNA polymerase/3'-5' exonuclease PolX [Streptosporangiaceae bacterium]